MVKLLIINDDIESLQVMSQFLEINRFEIIGKLTSGYEAYKLYKENHPDIVIIDFHIPENQKEYAIDMIKSYDPQAKILVILENPFEKFDENKVSNFLIKPFKPEELALTIFECENKATSPKFRGVSKTEKILKEIGYMPITSSEKEVFEFLQNIPKNCHPKLFFQNKSFRDSILKKYFNTSIEQKTSSGFFAAGQPSIKTTNSIRYKDLVSNNKILLNKVKSFFLDTIESNKSKNVCRFACEDTVWFKENGLFTLHQLMSKNLNQQILDKSAIFCCYDISRLEDEHIRIILKNSRLIITENPLRIYERIEN